MLVLFASGTAATPPLPERAAWYDCLDAYAQVAAAGRSSPTTIALEAMRTCSVERKQLQTKLWQSRVPSDNERALRGLQEEDRAGARRVVELVNRAR